MNKLVLLGVIPLLAACASPGPAPTLPPVAQTVVVTQTVIATAQPTATSPSSTAAPTLTPTNAPSPTGGVTEPRGLTAVNVIDSDRVGRLFDNRTYTNPSIAGLTFRTSWADIEPTQDNFVWTKVDTIFDNAEKNSKWVELILIPGFGTPQWALKGVPTSIFSANYGPGKGDQLPLPLPWDEIYLTRWFAFLKVVSARYQNRASFLKIAADGPTSITGEMTLPNQPADRCTWIKLGYTSDRIINAWKQVFSNYAQIFPRQFFSLALFPPLPIVSTTRCENGNPVGISAEESQRVTALIVALGADNYPKQFIVQENGLSASKSETLVVNSGDYGVVKSYAGKVIIGFQLSTSAIRDPTAMGDPDGPTALRKSLQLGLDAHVQFIQVQEPDVLAPGAQSVLATVAGALGH